jgi:Mn-dependent DtxR family transcriptional regulator
MEMRVIFPCAEGKDRIWGTSAWRADASLRKISEDYRVSQTTARKVSEALASEGLVEIKPRWGSFVR